LPKSTQIIALSAKIEIFHSFVVAQVVEKTLLLVPQKIFLQLTLDIPNGLPKKRNGTVLRRGLVLVRRVIVNIGLKLFGVRLHKLVVGELSVPPLLVVTVCPSGVSWFAITQHLETFQIN